VSSTGNTEFLHHDCRGKAGERDSKCLCSQPFQRMYRRVAVFRTALLWKAVSVGPQILHEKCYSQFQISNTIWVIGPFGNIFCCITRNNKNTQVTLIIHGGCILANCRLYWKHVKWKTYNMPMDFLSDTPWEALIVVSGVKMVGQVSETVHNSVGLHGSFYCGCG
jgi:hypothetical protein